jgi:Tol biopolymer transport system component
MGRENLKGLKKPDDIPKKEGITASQMWSEAQDTYAVSPDGRYLNYIDWANISINIKDLHDGTTRVVSKVGTWIKPNQFPDKSIWSPDGKKLAYYWFVGNVTELHIVNMDGTSDKIIAKGMDYTAPWPVSWTPDGKYILAITTENIKNIINHKMVQVSVIDGSVKVLKDYKNLSCGGSIDISPDNKYIVYDIQQNVNSQQNDIHILSLDGTMDKKLVGDLGNDSSPFWAPNGKEILFVSDRYGTNDLWKLKIENGTPIGVSKIVKSDLGSRNRILGITKDKAIFYGTNNSRIDVYIADMKMGANKNVKRPLKISSLKTKRNMNAVWSPNGQFVAYSRFNPFRDEILGHQQQFTIYDTESGTRKNLDTDMFGNTVMYNPQWTSDNEKLLIQGMIKDDYQGGLFLFDINTNKKTAIKVSDNMTVGKIDDEYRFYTLSNDDKSIFYFSEDKKSILKYTIKSKLETTIISGSKTIHFFELSNDNTKITFGYWFENDKNLYTVSTSGDGIQKLMEFDCDCADNVVSWGKDDKFIYFKDGKFRNFKKLLRISVNGGAPEEMIVFSDIFENGTVTRVNIHPDESSILVELEVGQEEVWKLEGIFSE